jgi:hypothetical protein
MTTPSVVMALSIVWTPRSSNDIRDAPALHEGDRLIASQGGPLRGVYFVDCLKRADECDEYDSDIPVFIGDETPYESLKKLVFRQRIPRLVSENMHMTRRAYSLATISRRRRYGLFRNRSTQI